MNKVPEWIVVSVNSDITSVSWSDAVDIAP